MVVGVAFVDVGWWVFAGLVGIAGVALWLWFRRLRRWNHAPPTSPEAKQAEARLWSTRLNEQR